MSAEEKIVPLRDLPGAERERVAVLGAGASGLAAARLLRSAGREVVILDSGADSTREKIVLAARALRCEFFGGAKATGHAADCAWAVISPGIPLSAPLAEEFLRAGKPLIGEIELAWRFCGGRVVAVTGTNGKTTTTALTWRLLEAAGVDAVACGNIGLPFSEAVLRQEKAKVFVVEVSSFQLETINGFSPDVAVWTNFSPNHLDRYRNVDEYFAAKARIFEFQSLTQHAVVQWGTRLPEKIRAGVTRFSASSAEAEFCLRGGWLCGRGRDILRQEETRLTGNHNAENLLAAFAVLDVLGVATGDEVLGAARSFEAPAHRCEPVGEVGEVLFINDSKATTLDALEKAIVSQSRPVVLIAGGKDKGFDYQPLAGLVRTRLRSAVLIGQMREKIARDWHPLRCLLAETLEEAVETAWRESEPGGVVLFSPGTSSFDMFSSFEERGEAFRRAVEKLAARQGTKPVPQESPYQTP